MWLHSSPYRIILDLPVTREAVHLARVADVQISMPDFISLGLEKITLFYAHEVVCDPWGGVPS